MEEENVSLPPDYVQRVINKLFQFKPTDEKNVLNESEITDIIGTATRVFEKEASLLELKAPINIVGDVHGCFFEMLELVKKSPIGDQPFLFLGDYIDRGKYGIEIVILLFALKIKNPSQFYLIRGNHESLVVSQKTTPESFYQQCCSRYNEFIAKSFFQSFQYLPIGALIENRMLCLHGGISPELKTLDQIRNIKRPMELTTEGLLCDLFWSDPLPTPDQLPIPNTPNTSNSSGFVKNIIRGCSYFYGEDVLQTFLTNNKLTVLCRAHQCVDGFRFSPTKKCLTVFSCPAYANGKNRSGLLIVAKDLNCQFIFN